MNHERLRLARVLRQIAHDAGLALIGPADPRTTRFCAAQYERVCARLRATDTQRAEALPRLPSSPAVGDVRIAARTAAAALEAWAPSGAAGSSWFERWFSPGRRWDAACLFHP